MQAQANAVVPDYEIEPVLFYCLESQFGFFYFFFLPSQAQATCFAIAVC